LRLNHGSSLIKSTIFFAPLIAVIVIFLKTISKFPSFFLFQLLFADISILIWGFAGIPVLTPQDFFSMKDLIFIEQIGVIFGSIAFILVIFTFSHPLFGNKLLFFSRIGIIIFGLIAGIKVSLILIKNPNASIYGLYIVNDSIKRYTDPFITNLVLIGFSLLILVIIMYSFWQNKFPSYLISENIKKQSFYASIMMTTGVAMNYTGLILPISILEISSAFFLISRFFITFGFIFLTIMVTQNPIIILKERSNPKYLVENGVVGWMLVVNTDQGPELKVLSPNSKNRYDLDDKYTMLFAVSSISIVGIGQNFADTQFIIPYPTKEKELSVICYSFTMFDPTLKDFRRNNIADIVFGLIIPNYFLNYLGNIGKGSFSLISKLHSFKTLQELISQLNFSDETCFTLRNLLVHKII
jgi:hypothetical protein